MLKKEMKFEKGILPKISSRMLKGAHYSMSAAYRSDGGGADDDEDDDDDDDDAEHKKEERMLIKKIRKILDSEFKKRSVSKSDVDAIRDGLSGILPNKEGKVDVSIDALRALADEKTGAMAAIAKQGIELQKMKQREDEEIKMSIRSSCKKFLEDNKEVIRKIRSGSKSAISELPVFELNMRDVANPMLPSNVMPSGTDYITKTQVQPGIVDLLRPEPTFWDVVPKGTTNAENYVWVNKRPTEGSGAFISPGEYKPPISFTVRKESSHAKKVAVSAKMATELLEDIDGFASWVESEIRYQLDVETNDKLMNSVGDTENPTGLQQLSTAYDPLTGVVTDNPNVWDAMIAVIAMLRLKLFKGRIVILINPVDYTNAVITKAVSQGQLFTPPPIGALIVQDTNIAKGHIQAVAISYYKLLVYKAFSLAWGHENDDFTKNLLTVIGERRLHQFVSENHAGLAVYDSIEDIKAAIAIPPAEPEP